MIRTALGAGFQEVFIDAFTHYCLFRHHINIQFAASPLFSFHSPHRLSAYTLVTLQALGRFDSAAP